MRRLVETAFPKSIDNDCIEENTSDSIVIHDDDSINKSCIYKSTDPLKYPKFTINNPSKKRIHFLAIDNCVLFSTDGNKCDFAAFDNATFLFVEIKKGGGSVQNRSTKKGIAVSQLKKTIELFFDLIDFSKFRVFACISVGYFTKSPAAAASDLDLLVEFINEYNVELIEGNEFEFK